MPEYPRTVIGDEFWDKFIAISKAYLEYDEEVTIYDIFNFIREELNGGWKFTNKYLNKIDAELLAEEG